MYLPDDDYVEVQLVALLDDAADVSGSVLLNPAAGRRPGRCPSHSVRLRAPTATEEEVSTGGGGADDLHNTKDMTLIYLESWLSVPFHQRYGIWHEMTVLWCLNGLPPTRSFPRFTSANVYFSAASEAAGGRRQSSQSSFRSHMAVAIVTEVMGTWGGAASRGSETQLGSFPAGELTVWGADTHLYIVN